MAGDYTPEGAVFGWMYSDAASGWGHRHNILNCTFTNAGAGVATATATLGAFGTGAAIYTVDFIASARNAYVPLVVPPGTAKPMPQKVLTITSTVDAGNFVNIALTAEYFPAYTSPNAIKWVFVWTPANWGQPSGTIPALVLGQSPVGAGGVACPVVSPAALPDGVTADPGATTYSCTLSTPYQGAPVEIDAVDTYGNVLRLVTNPVPPM